MKRLKRYLARILCISIGMTMLPMGTRNNISAWGSSISEDIEISTPSNADAKEEECDLAEEKEYENPKEDNDKQEEISKDNTDFATDSNASSKDKENNKGGSGGSSKPYKPRHKATKSNAEKEFSYQYKTNDGIIITITAEPDALPSGTSIRIQKADGDSHESMAAAADQSLQNLETVSGIYAYDIAFFDHGEEFEPEEDAVRVTFDLSGVLDKNEDSHSLKVFHILEEEEEIEQIEKAEIGEQSISFLANSFSIYGVAVINETADFQIEGTTLVAYKGTSKRVVIPNGIQTIGERVFEDNTTVQEIIIPDSVESIRKMAFAYAVNLKRVEIGSGLSSAYTCIFTGTSSLKEIIVNPQNPYFYAENGVLRKYGSNSIYYYPGGKTDKKYVIPEGVTYINFGWNKHVEEIFISKDVEILDLGGLNSLKKIVVDEENKNFCVVDDVLYNSDMTRIIHYPTAKKGAVFIVPQSVTAIGDGSYHAVFSGAGELRKLYFLGSCPKDASYSTPWQDWYTGFESNHTYQLYYYDDASWHELQEAYENKFGMQRYFQLTFHPVTKGISIISEKNSVLIGNTMQLKIEENDLANAVVGREIIPEYWKVKDTVNLINKNGVFSGKKAGKAIVQAGGKGIPEVLEKEIRVIESPDQYSKISNSREWNVLKLTNKVRMAAGKGPLSMFAELQKATDVRKKELETLYSHTRPDGTSCFTVLDGLNITGSGFGENIAYGYETEKKVLNAWMASPGHRANILDDDFTHMGAGYTIKGQQSGPSWVQMFMYDSGDTYEELLIDQNAAYQLKKGKSVESLNIPVICYCSKHGITYIPLIDEMCTGLDVNKVGTQKITITYQGLTENLNIEITPASSGGSGGGGGGGGSSGGGGGGGSSSTRKGTFGGPGGSQGSGETEVPAYVVVGEWKQNMDGKWSFTDVNNQLYINRWAAIYNPYANTAAGARAYDWFRFDENGFMVTGWFIDMQDQNTYYLNPVSDGTCGRMLTGWAMIDGGEYYFNPNSDGFMGRMLRNENTGDGHFVGANGVKQY